MPEIEGAPVIPDWPQDAQDALYAQLKMLDPQKEGIGLAQMRSFYPSLGWANVRKGLTTLQSAGKVTSKHVRPAGGKVSIETFFWQ